MTEIQQAELRYQAARQLAYDNALKYALDDAEACAPTFRRLFLEQVEKGLQVGEAFYHYYRPQRSGEYGYEYTLHFLIHLERLMDLPCLLEAYTLITDDKTSIKRMTITFRRVKRYKRGWLNKEPKVSWDTEYGSCWY